MRKRCLYVLLVAVGLTWGPLACSRTNLDAIKRVTALDGGSGTGGSGTGGNGTGGNGTGGNGTGGNGTGGRGTGGNGTGGSGTGGATASVTCPTPALQPGEETVAIQVGALSRTYIRKVPSTYDGSKPVPLILDFHAIAGNASMQKNASPYPQQTAPDGVIMAFPNGMTGPLGPAWNVGPCCVSPSNGVPVDDVAFARAIVDQVSIAACIDPKRVYAVGFSMGGGMAYYLACNAADVFAAVAPAAFEMTTASAASCAPRRAITVISFRVTGDPIVPFGGGASNTVPGMPVTFLSAQEDFQKWRDLDGCTGAPVSDSNGCSSYTTCRDNAEVILCTKPGTVQEQGNASIAWPVLKRHTLPLP